MLLQLNEDVVSHIISYLSIRDSLNLSVAARGIHLVARQHAYSVVEIDDLTPTGDQVYQFCLHMLDDIPGRLHWLRGLTIAFRHPNRTSVATLDNFRCTLQRLANLIECAEGTLQSLSLTPIEVLVELEPQIFTAIRNVRYLRKLELDSIGTRALGLVRQLRSRPRTLILHAEDRGTISTALLLNSIGDMSNLRTFSVCDSLVGRRNAIPVVPFSGGVWPGVDNLTVISYWGISKSTCVRAFPGIRTLQLWVYREEPEPQAIVDDACWSYLDCLQVFPFSFRYWNIICPTHFVSIESILGFSLRFTPASSRDAVDASDKVDAKLIVHSTSPVALNLGTVADLEFTPRLWMDLVAVAPRLRCLQLELQLMREGRDALPELIAVLHQILPIISQLKNLYHIELCINSAVVNNFSVLPDRKLVSPTRFSLGPDSTKLRVAEKLAGALIEHLPSVHWLSVGFGFRGQMFQDRRFDPFHGTFWWWNVENDGKERKLHPMSTFTGERIRGYLCSPEYDYRTDPLASSLIEFAVSVRYPVSLHNQIQAR
ncbi:uncharacterized protein FIBRA_03147 [Fibroporia radiculosa]|uniref:F-box domain-containing protein n=1 Tax=Fibroporia radiculosa TaxID=599839 RepID=J4H288_9APHY|nr:uncharacterized protein FIBRA_03147 [Fibroporia radiculosa]CCM01099.1 predicted protein [Fibroporia radiculosa]